MEQRFVVDAFTFETSQEYNKAKKESEAISYIRAKTDLSNPMNVIKVYNKLMEKQNFTTPIGICFLKELYDSIIQSNVISKENLRTITMKKEIQRKNEDSVKLEAGDEKKLRSQVLLFETKYRNSKIVCAFLVIVILAIFAITAFGDDSPFKDAEMKLQDKYAAWSEELEEREQAVTEREAALEHME